MAGLAVHLGSRLSGGEARAFFLPGATSDGHHQIEIACETCHGRAFEGPEALQAACVRCHGEELAQAKDAHPRTKFTDPRNAERVALLDARTCLACHREHQPESTLAMGLTLPADYCHRCHADVAGERPSHAGIGFESCASGGCHNFHDNRALYEDFLAAHQGEPAHRPAGAVARLTATPAHAPALREAQADAPLRLASHAAVREWAASAHARGGVNCTACHGAERFEERLDHSACRECHPSQVEGFLRGRHGMRLDAGLSAMRPGLARLPMKAEARDRRLGCTSCHGAHAMDLRAAAVDACLGCHDDAHSSAYPASAHARSFEAERRGELGAGQGVSCATCHLPRHTTVGGAVHAQHNQNENLRPNEKMARSVCLACHGLGFTLDALADADLVRRSFGGSPGSHVESLDWVAARRTKEEER
jgi:hypothetical protein